MTRLSANGPALSCRPPVDHYAATDGRPAIHPDPGRRRLVPGSPQPAPLTARREF